MYNSTYTTTSYPDTYAAASTLSGAEAAALGGTMLVFGIGMLIVAIITIISMWKLYAKAGKPGWASLIPVYREIVQLEIAGRPAWWVLLIMLVPFFGAWVGIVSLIDFVRSYQRSGWWVFWIVVAPVIALPLLAFQSKTHYRGPIAAGREDFMPAPVVAGAPAVATPPQMPPQTPQSM